MSEIASLNYKYLGEKEKDFKNRLIEGEKYLDIVIAGQFNSGKTTFLNALLMLESDKELPTSSLPLTSSPWKLQWSSKTEDFVNIFSVDGKEEKKKWSELKEIQKSKLQHNIDYFEAFIASDVLNLENCIFWDTPGFNDPKKDDSKTLNFLSDHEVIIFITPYEGYRHKIKIDEQEKELIEHIRCQINSECIVILTNSANSENFSHKKHEYCEEVQTYYLDKYNHKIKVIPLESKGALVAQRKLKQTADEMNVAVYDFLKNKDIDTYGKIDWTERVKKDSEDVRSSGIIEVRHAIKDITENKETFVVKSSGKRINRNVEKIIKKIEEDLKKKNDEFVNAKKEKEDFVIKLNAPKDEDLFNIETMVQNASKKIVRFFPEYFSEYKGKSKEKIQDIIKNSDKWYISSTKWVENMNKSAGSEIPKFIEEKTKEFVLNKMVEQYKETFKTVITEDLSMYAKDNNIGDDFINEKISIFVEKQVLEKMLDEIFKSTSSQCVKILKEKVDDKNIKCPPLDEINNEISDILQKALETEIELITKNVFPKYFETRTELKYEMVKIVKENNEEKLEILRKKQVEREKALDETKKDLSILIDKRN